MQWRDHARKLHNAGNLILFNDACQLMQKGLSVEYVLLGKPSRLKLVNQTQLLCLSCQRFPLGPKPLHLVLKHWPQQLQLQQ